MREKAYFVTQLKKNAVYKLIKKNPVKAGGNIISDYEMILPILSKEIKLRKIIVRDPETKKCIVLLTNNMEYRRARCAVGGIPPQKI